MKSRSGYIYEIDALVKFPTDEITGIKITDDLELTYVMESAKIHVLYTPINAELSSLLLL